MPSLTITYAAPEANDIADAVGDILGLSGQANAAQVKQLLIRDLAVIVRNYKQKKAIELAITGITDIAPT